MKHAMISLLLCSAALLSPVAHAQAGAVEVRGDDTGMRLQVDGEDFLVRGVNWNYTPAGKNYSYSLWSQPDHFVERVLHEHMRLLKDMGVNAIRQFSTVPPRWVKWIHERYGIYTVINHMMGRYGATIDGVWIPHIDYSNAQQRRALIVDLEQMVLKYKDVPGVLMWFLGNENNYGLHWTGYDIEALPGQEDAARAVSLYSMWGDAVRAIKKHDSRHPVAIVNGDIQYIDLIAEHCAELDVLASNVYRGVSVRDMYQQVKDKLGIPLVFSEFGADAYDARRRREDHVAQAEYLRAQWQEIYEQSAGKGREGNAVGGFVFQWSDEWWKSNQEDDLDIHDTTATWPNGAYPRDFVAGQNNMNEEWFGITAIGPPDAEGWYEVRPRAAYYLLREAFSLDAYAPATDLARVRAHFDNLQAREYAHRYDATRAAGDLAGMRALRLSNLELRFETYNTRGDRRTERGATSAFDHTESFFTELTLQPSAEVYGRLALNLVGNVAQNRLNPIFYENRGRAATVSDTEMAAASEDEELLDPNRVAIYQAEVKLQQRYFDLEGYYRTGHHHWGDEGDFFGLYRNAYYGPSLDIYNGNAPLGMVITGKRAFDGIKVAFGPELYWGANPSVITKYARQIGPTSLTLMHQEDVSGSAETSTSSVVPEPRSRRSTLHLSTTLGKLQLGVGGIFAAPRRVGQNFTWTRATSGRGYLDSGYEVLQDQIAWMDTLGARVKAVWDAGRLRWYAEGAYKGLVADSGVDSTITLTGWSMKASGRGNQMSGLAGLAVDLGRLQIAPNLLYQRPLIGPITAIDDFLNEASGTYYRAVPARNVFDDPFVVLDNRETFGGELLLVYDPTPETWFWHWDRENREDAPFAASLDLVYRHQPTVRDSNIGFLADGTRFSFNASPPAQDVWDATATWVSAAHPSIRVGGTLFGGQGQSRGLDDRRITRFGGSLRLVWYEFLMESAVHIDDWGPYDYHKDFNLTYPLQVINNLSFGLAPAVFGALDTRIGLRGLVRTLDQYSEGYLEEATGTGLEYEVGTYLNVTL